MFTTGKKFTPKKYSPLKNVHPWKNIHSWKSSPLKNIPPWKIFTREKYSPLKKYSPQKNIPPEKYSPLKYIHPWKTDKNWRSHAWFLSLKDQWIQREQHFSSQSSIFIIIIKDQGALTLVNVIEVRKSRYTLLAGSIRYIFHFKWSSI